MKFFFVIVTILGLGTLATAQQKTGFEKEVADLTKRIDSIWDRNAANIIFTGSSSIRLWKDLEQRFPKHQILNTGFGGSTMSDLIAHLDELVLNYAPSKVFIYEGDNDIFNKKSVKAILSDFKAATDKIKKEIPNVGIYLISPKPSKSRWHLKSKYKRLNRKLKKLSQTDASLFFINVWDSMLNGKKLNHNLFIEDGLHMNQTGYDLWKQQIAPFLE